MKRGLIDPLGTLIKSISGNLDFNDAIKYDNAIKILQNNDEILSKNFNRHISLCKKWIVEQNQTLSTLIRNQNKLNKALLTLSNSTLTNNDKLINYAHLNQLFNIITDNANDLYTEMLRIENILAYSKINNVHHSILSIASMKDIIENLHKIYDSEQILHLNLRDYYTCIRIGSYFSGNKLVVVLRVPIIYKSTFDLYKLCPLPNKNQEILVPPYPLIATNSLEHVYMEAECPKSGDWYICEQRLSHQIRTDQDCIQKLIHTQEVDETCKSTPISLSKEALLELDDQHYAVSFPKPTKVEIKCQQEQYVILKGSYVATVPQYCSMKTQLFTIINSNNKVRGQPLKIMYIPQKKIPTKNSEDRTGVLKMNSINLSNLEKIEQQLAIEKPIQIDRIQSTNFYHTSIPLYLLTLSGAGALAFILYRRHRAATVAARTNASVQTEEQNVTTFAVDSANSCSA